MGENNHESPGLGTLASRVVRTGAGALQNRVELFAVEWREERARLSGMLMALVALAFLSVVGVLLVTAVVIFLFPEELRIYAAAALAILFLLGAVATWFGLRGLLKHEPFGETLGQLKKDREWLETLK